MRTRILMGVIFLSTLILSAFAFAQSGMEGPLESPAPPKLGISGENISVERNGSVLTLYWSGRIDLVKPSSRPVTLSVRCAVEPAGKWNTRPRNRVISDTFVSGVNSSFHKFELGEIILSGEAGSTAISPTSSLFEKNQVVVLKLTLGQQKKAQEVPSIEEREYRLSPLGYMLLAAARSGNVAEVRTLLEDGAAPDSANIGGWDALMAACSAGHLDVARLLVEKDANLVAQTKGFAFSESANGSPVPMGATPLLIAAYSGKADIVRFLLDSGATYGDYVKRVKQKGASDEEIVALLEDTGPKRQQVVEQLISQGVDRKDIDVLLTRGGFADIVWRISKRGVMYAGIAERLKQSGATDEVIASRLKKKGATDEDVRKAMAGKWVTQDAIRQAIIEKGASKDEAGAMLNARKLGKNSVRTCLKDKGANPEEIESLMRDRTRDDEAIRSFLREKGVASEDVENCLTVRGALAEDTVRFLIRHGGTVNAMRGDKWTPLIAASFSGNPQVVNMLLNEGADPKATDALGYSPLALARINGNTSVDKLLKSRGASIRVPWNPMGIE